MQALPEFLVQWEVVLLPKIFNKEIFEHKVVHSLRSRETTQLTVIVTIKNLYKHTWMYGSYA